MPRPSARKPPRRRREPREDLALHRALLEIVRGLGGRLDLHAAMELVFGVVEHLLPTDSFLLALRREGQYQVLFQADLDDHNERIFFPVPRMMRPHGIRIVEKLKRRPYYLEHRTAAALRRLQTRGNAPPGKKDLWTMTGNTARRSASLLFVPIRFGAETAGVLSAQCYRFQAYRPEHVERLRAVADYVALAAVQIGGYHHVNTGVRQALRRILDLLGDLRKQAEEGAPAIRPRLAQAREILDRLRDALPATSA